MVFSSVVFVFYFLPLFLILYYVCGVRNGALLFGSLIFYTWGEGGYLFLLALLVLINFYAGLLIARAEGRPRVVLLATGITTNLAVLAFFKYTGFIVSTIGSLTGGALPVLDIHLPLGISFFTFQLISYLVDVTRKSIAADHGLIRFATYVMMFPHLIAGPIVRYADIDAELRKRQIDIEKVGLGVQYFIVGMCQKVLIANTVAVAADKGFSLPVAELSALTAWIGVIAYTLQIYFDFCGYSNMAIGLAFLMGFRFPRNFEYPYMSRSITEFWRRWHISLSFWFRDYVFIPLGGGRSGQLRTIRNLLIVFFLTGLWHGASWTFVLWGMFHGAFLMLERLVLRALLERAPTVVSWAYAMLVIMIGWVLFRANNLNHAASIVSAMFGGASANSSEPIQLWLTPEVMVAILAGVVFSFPIVPRTLEALKVSTLPGPVVPGTSHRQITVVHPIPIPLLVIGFVLSAALLVGSSLNPFLYFRF